VVGPAPMRVQGDQATTFAIILNELIANAIEHGFEGRERGEIRISAAEVDGEATVRVADDGRSLPADFSVEASAGLGLQLVRGLAASDLRGAFRVFELQGSPDLHTPADHGEGTDGGAEGEPPPAAEEDSGTRGWIISELRFPLAAVEPAEPGALTREALPDISG